VWALAFGIVTPKTVQGAAFEEDGGADAWTIMNREPFSVEDGAFDHTVDYATKRLMVFSYSSPILSDDVPESGLGNDRSHSPSRERPF